MERPRVFIVLNKYEIADQVRKPSMKRPKSGTDSGTGNRSRRLKDLLSNEEHNQK